MTTITSMPTDIAADLRAHGIDPATAVYAHDPESIRNGRTTVRVGNRTAAYWPLDHGWVLAIDGAVVRHPRGGPDLFASAGAALAREG